MKKTRLLALALAVVMAFSAVSVSAFAAYTSPTTSELKNKVDNPNKNLLIDWDFSGVSEGGAFASINSTSDAKYNHNIASHKNGSTKIGKVTKSGFSIKNNLNSEYGYIYESRDGAFYFNRKAYEANATESGGKTTYPDSYVYLGISSDWITAYSKTGADNGVNAVYSDYAGKSFTYSYDLKLDFTPAGGAASWMSKQIGMVASTWNTAKSMIEVAPFGVNRANGVLGYYEAGTGAYVETGVTLSNKYYVNIAVFVDVPGNSFDIYADGVLVAEGKKYLTDAQIATIFGPSANLSTADVSDGKTWQQVAVANDPLATPEQKANPMLCYAFNHVRFLQYCPESIYIDNIRFYFDDECYETYNSANTVEGYDLTINNGTLGLNYYLNLQRDVLADENAKVVFTTPRGVQEISIKNTPVRNDGTYKFTAKVSSVEMASAIKMEIVSGEKVYNIYKNGTASEAYEYSVKEYADALIAGEYAEAMKNVAKAMLNYGAAAQVYFGYNTEKLASENYTEALAQVTSNDISAVTIAGTAPAGTKAALILDSDTSIVIYNAQGEKIGEQTGINSKNLDASYVINCEGGTVTVSVLAIGEKVLESGTASAEYKNLIKALKLFSDASKAV